MKRGGDKEPPRHRLKRKLINTDKCFFLYAC